jgi:hypothetical protein
MDGRLNIVKMSVLHIELYIQCDSNKNFSRVFIEVKVYKLILKFIWKWGQLRITITIFRNKKVGKLILPVLKPHHKVRVINIAQNWWKNQHLMNDTKQRDSPKWWTYMLIIYTISDIR